MEQWPVLKFFKYEHLPERLRAISKPFSDLAYDLVNRTDIEHYCEAGKALDKLLEAKDCAVRAFLKV